MKEYKYFIIYKTTCVVNNKIYVGHHRTNNLNDKYLGSGILLNYEIKLFGEDKFKREILFQFNNEKDMIQKEVDIVNEEFVAREDTYNCRIEYNGHNGTLKANEVRWKRWHENPELMNEWIEKMKIASHTKEALAKRSATLKKKWKENDNHPWTGRKHNDESKKKIGKANSKYQSGKGNSNYGNCWIHSLETKISKSIPKSDLQKWLDQGWIKGRKIKSW